MITSEKLKAEAENFVRTLHGTLVNYTAMPKPNSAYGLYVTYKNEKGVLLKDYITIGD